MPDSRLRGQSGIATTEAVLVTPVLLFLVMLVIQFGLWFHAQHVAQAAAEEGARAARSASGSASAGQERSEAFLDQAGPTIITDRVVTASRTADIVTVEVHGRSVNVVPGIALPINATATSPVERFRVDPG
jgi:Flp pilus assembly protein TadG